VLEKTGSLEMYPFLCWIGKDVRRPLLAQKLRDTALLEMKWERIFSGIIAFLALPTTFLFAYTIYKTLNSGGLAYHQTLNAYFCFSAFWLSVAVLFIWAIILLGVDEPSPMATSFLEIYRPYLFIFSIQAVYTFHFTFFFNVSHGSGIVKTGTVAFILSMLSIFLVFTAGIVGRLWLGLSLPF
jgi:hypothetical protein